MNLNRIIDTRDLSVGDVIQFTCNGRGRGGHYNVTAKITKVNRKTVKAVEHARSYRPGTLWTVPVNDYDSVYKRPV